MLANFLSPFPFVYLHRIDYVACFYLELINSEIMSLVDNWWDFLDG
jgi:hypothetical protein